MSLAGYVFCVTSHVMVVSAGMVKPVRRLTISEKREIEALLRAGEETHETIGARFNVSRRTILRIANPKTATDAKSTSAAAPFSVRATPEELDALDATWRGRGYGSRNHLLRHLVRVAAEVTDPDPESAAELAEIARQLRGVAVNINQMAKAANRGKLAWTGTDKAEMAALAKTCGRLSREISGTLGQAARRVRADKLHGVRDG